MPRNEKRSKETRKRMLVSWAGDSAMPLPQPRQQSSELLFNYSAGCARTQGCLSAQRLVWPASVGVFSCTRQCSLHLLDACWLAGTEREWPGAREEGEWGVAAEKQLTTASRATANLGLWLHLGPPRCSVPLLTAVFIANASVIIAPVASIWSLNSQSVCYGVGHVNLWASTW